MKKIVLALTLFLGAGISAQTDAFGGKGDTKVNIGANIQSQATGIMASVDYGMGESFSFGIQAGYLLGVTEDVLGEKARAEHRFDAKVRANANLGDVIGLPQNFDIYPGLDLGLKNFGAHIGMRYFFNKGFGLFTETQFPIAKFNADSNAPAYRKLNNQFAFLIGASFDISRRAE